MKFKIAEQLSEFNFGEDFTNAGRAHEKKITAKDVDAKELERGIEVEMEHTTNKDIAERIALDHLAELKDYYTRLAKMEEEGKKEGAEVKDKAEEKDAEDAKDDKDDADADVSTEDKEEVEKTNSLKV